MLPLSVLVLILQGCYYDKADKLYPASGISCDTSNITYSTTIKGILQANCAISGCHDASSQAGGYDYTTYAGFVVTIQSNRLLGAINHLNGYFAMPETGSKLSDCDISKITAWVNNGYPNN